MVRWRLVLAVVVTLTVSSFKLYTPFRLLVDAMLGPNGPGLGGQTPRHNVSLIPKQTPRFTGQYLQRMTPRHTAQTTQRTSYIFPTLKPSEILQCMNDLQIPFTEEDLAKPTALRMQMAYEAFIDIFMGITAEQFENSEAQLANLVEHPNIYTNSAQLIIFSRHIGRLMREVGIDDFSLRDILKPEPGRVRKIISAVINFAKFREEQMVIYDKYVNQADELAQELEQLQNEQQELQDQISQAKHRRAQDEPQIQKTRDKNTALLEEIKQCLGVQESLVSEVNGLRSEYKELGDTVARNQNTETEYRNRLNDLKSKIVRDPERAKEELQEMSTSVLDSKQTISLLEQKHRQLELRVTAMDAVAQEITACLKLQDDCLAEEIKAEESAHYAALLREQLEQKQLRLRELDLSQQRLSRQVCLVQDKLGRLEKQKSMKLDGLRAKKQQLQEEFDRVTAESATVKDKVNRNKRLTEEMEQRTSELVESTERALRQMHDDYIRLKHQVEMYQHELQQLLNA